MNNNFSESITFTAEGLDKVIEQTRVARQETDQLAASQQRFADQMARRMGYSSGAQASQQQRLNQLSNAAMGPGYQRRWGETLREYGAVYQTARARYYGGQGTMPGQMQSTAFGGAGNGFGGVSRASTIRIQAQTVQLVGPIAAREAEISKTARAMRERGETHFGGGGVGGNLVAAGVLAQSVSSVSRSIEKTVQQVKQADQEIRQRSTGDQRRSDILARAPKTAIDAASITEGNASQRKRRLKELMEDPRADAMERFRAAMNYQPSLAFESKIANPTAPDAMQDIGMLDFIAEMKKSLSTLTAKQLEELGGEFDLPGRSKFKTKEKRVNFLTGQAANRIEDANQAGPSKEEKDETTWRRQYAEEMKRLTSLSTRLRQAYDTSVTTVKRFNTQLGSWWQSDSRKANWAGAKAVGRAWWEDSRDARSKMGYAAAGAAAVGAGMAWQGLSNTVTGQRFQNEITRVQMELANVFGPALRKATDYLRQFGEGLSDLSPRQQRMLMYGGLGVTAFAGLRAAGMGGLVTRPLDWAAGGAVALAGAGLNRWGGAGVGANVGANAAGVFGAAKGFPFHGVPGGGAAAAGAGAGAAAAGGAGVFAGWGIGAAASAAMKSRLAGLGAVGRFGPHALAAGGGFMAGQYLRSQLVTDYADERMSNFDRRSRGDFSTTDFSEFGGRVAKLAEIDKPDDRRKSHLKREQELLKAQREHESQYSTFGKYIGDVGLFGGRLGTYGKKAEAIQAELQAVEQQRVKDQAIVEKKNKEALAGGGFEGFLDTYRRTEEAAGKLSGELKPGQMINNAIMGNAIPNALPREEKLEQAVELLREIAEQGKQNRMPEQKPLQRNW